MLYTVATYVVSYNMNNLYKLCIVNNITEYSSMF